MLLGERSQPWLDATLRRVWATHFSDVPVVNVVRIAYVRPSRTRLGWIALSESGQYTQIGVNRLLSESEAPEAVSLITIAHELVHYGHGFGSPLPQRCADPHADGIVERELVARGFAELLHAYEEWTERCWLAFYERHRPPTRALAVLDVPGAEPAARRGGRAALDLPSRRTNVPFLPGDRLPSVTNGQTVG